MQERITNLCGFLHPVILLQNAKISEIVTKKKTSKAANKHPCIVTHSTKREKLSFYAEGVRVMLDRNHVKLILKFYYFLAEANK